MRRPLCLLTALLLTTPATAARLAPRPIRATSTAAPVDPLAGELARWPSAHDTEAVLAWSLDHLDWIEANAALDPRGRQDWLALRDATMCSLQGWVYLREAQFLDYTERSRSCIGRFYARRGKIALGVWYATYDQSLDGRRAALKRLHDRLGWLEYGAGRLPHPAVLAAFRSID
jgi:hypothetical protein